MLLPIYFRIQNRNAKQQRVIQRCFRKRRQSHNADSSLKNREYCARGILFVIAYEDWDFPETFPFVHRISKDDTPVDVSQVIKWHENLIKEYPNYSMEMRRYAEENLSWDAKMKPVIEKIKELGKLKERKQNT